jgi:hypothetical protein
MYKKYILAILILFSLTLLPACKKSDSALTLESEIAMDKDFTPLNPDIYTNPEIHNYLDNYGKASVISAKSMLENSLKLRDKKSTVTQLMEISKLYGNSSLMLKYDQEGKAKKLSNFARRCAELIDSGKKPLTTINNLSTNIRQQIKDVNNALKQQIEVNDKTGAVRSLNHLAFLHQQQVPDLSSQTMRQKCLFTVDMYRGLAAEAKSGDYPLKRIQVDKLASTNDC